MESRNLVPSNFAILAGGFYRMTADLRCMLSDAGIRSEQPGCGYPIPEIGTERAGGRYPALFAWPVLVAWIDAGHVLLVCLPLSRYDKVG